MQISWKLPSFNECFVCIWFDFSIFCADSSSFLFEKKKSLETSKWVFYWLCIAASLQVCFYCSSAYDAKDLMIFLEKSSMGERT